MPNFRSRGSLDLENSFRVVNDLSMRQLACAVAPQGRAHSEMFTDIHIGLIAACV